MWCDEAHDAALDAALYGALARLDVHTKVTEGLANAWGSTTIRANSLAVDELLGKLCACTANFALEMQKYAKVC